MILTVDGKKLSYILVYIFFVKTLDTIVAAPLDLELLLGWSDGTLFLS